jgi:hypothetical protein
MTPTPPSSAALARQIFVLRGHRVMLSSDIARLYGVEPRVLVQAVKRNSERFPDDFMFQLTQDEFDNLKSQIVIASWGGARTPPYALHGQHNAASSRRMRPLY